MSYKEIQLTADESGHCIHNSQVFSPDDKWIVYDTRNQDTLIISTGSIRMVNVITKEIKELYKTVHQTPYGPGVGAATFSSTSGNVLFIHGIRNAGKENPYGITRRTGVKVNIKQPFHAVFMDARRTEAPFINGALRGGTHAHSWSGDGKWISFTYNDYVLEQLSKINPEIKDLRTVGVMAPIKKVLVSDTTSLENNSGQMFSVIVAKVTEKPRPGSDEIDKAFDEGWIGENGYLRADSSRQIRAIAFQGNVRDENDQSKTEVFVVDLPADLTKAQKDEPLAGTATTRPGIPIGAAQRRITYTPAGIEGPRHWLRTTPDGKLIGFLAKDKNGIVQIFGVSPNGGKIAQFTFNLFSVQGPFNFSPDDRHIAYIADNSIFLTNLKTLKAKRISMRFTDEEKPLSGVTWSHDGRMLTYNRYLKGKSGNFLQIFALTH
ncbi:MAG: DUF3748 domain-containing protein [Sphingobacteriaceae bacterium]